MKHYYTGYVVIMGENGYKHEPHRFVVLAEDTHAGAKLVRKEMGLGDRDAIHFDQTVGFDG